MNRRKENFKIKSNTKKTKRNSNYSSSRNKPISLVYDATCYMQGSGPGVPPGGTGVYSCRCKCYDDWRLDSSDEYWSESGCSNPQGGWNYYDWRENPMGGPATGCCTYHSQEMGRTSCLSECETYCGSDSFDVIRHNQNRDKSISLKVDPRNPYSVNDVVNQAVSWYKSHGVQAPEAEIRQTAQSAVDAYNNGNQTRAFIDWFKPCPCGSGHGKCAGQRTIGNPGPMGHQWNMSVCIGLISSINVY